MEILPEYRSVDLGSHNIEPHTLDAKKILLIATGSVSTMYLPAWVSWFSETYPKAVLRVMITHSAQAFLGMAALQAFAKFPIEVDSWEGHETEAYHVELGQWADAFVIYPATANYISRYAMGACDSPAMLALQSTESPVLLSPALPPGFLKSEAWRMHSEAIIRRPNAVIVPPTKGQSSFDSSIEAYPPQSFVAVIAKLMKIFSKQNDEAAS